MLTALADLLVPPACLVCRAGGARTLCGDCRRALRFLPAEQCCRRCGLPAPCSSGGGASRRRCPAAGAPWRLAWSPVAYAGPATGLVAALKTRGALPCARLMAAHVVAGAPPGLLLEGAVLVPVPTHPARARRRGYDQAHVLARALGARTGLPVVGCLRRTGRPTQQRGSTRAERLAEGRLELQCRGPAPDQVVLVDDVHTTGATLRAAALAVRAAGGADIVAVTWARTL